MKFGTCITLIIVTALICLACIACTYLRCAAAFEIATAPVRVALAVPDTGSEPERPDAWNPKGGL
jgi:hypothetical protein